MNRFLNRASNALFFILLIVFIYRGVTTFYSNSKFEGEPAYALNLLDLNLKQTTLITDIKPPYILIFWTSTCPPCLLELKRLQDAIDDKEIPADKIIAINVGESVKIISKFMKRNEYSFKAYLDPKGVASAKYELQGTPMAVHVNNKGIHEWISTGVSPLGIIRSKNLFSE